MATSPYENYLSTISEWEASPSLATLWYVVIDIGGLKILGDKNSFISNLNKYESLYFSNWDISKAVLDSLVKPTLHESSSNLWGCVFARQVNIPGEGIETTLDMNHGGYKSPHVALQRKKPSPLNITFLETNASFVDFIIRPWLVLTSYYGLLARPSNGINVRCPSINIYQLAKMGGEVGSPSLSIRKSFRFYWCAPVNIQDSALAQTDESVMNNQVTFIYDGYSVSDNNAISNVSRKAPQEGIPVGRVVPVAREVGTAIPVGRVVPVARGVGTAIPVGRVVPVGRPG
jgi:hypothetical protein